MLRRPTPLALLLGLLPSAQAQVFYWGDAISRCNAGTFAFNANCWTNTPGGATARGSMPPSGTGNSLQLSNSRAGSIAVKVTASQGALSYGGLLIDNTGSGNMVLWMTSGDLSFSSRSSIGQSGGGRLDVSAGVASFTDLTVAATAAATGAEVLISGTGTLTSQNLYLGLNGQAVLRQSGDSGLNATTGFSIGTNSGAFGRYDMSGGVATFATLTVGDAGRGEVVQTGGTVNSPVLAFAAGGGQGRYELRGGVLQTTGGLAGQGGELLIDGGQLQVAGAITLGRLEIGSQGSFALAAGRTLSSEQAVPMSGLFQLAGNAEWRAGGNVAGRLVLAGGTLTGSGLLASTGDVSGQGTIGGTLDWRASGSVLVSGGRLVLANGDRNRSSGAWSFGPGGALELANGSVLRNSGQFDLGGATVSGSGQLVNDVGGVMSGTGTVQTFLSNAGSLVLQTGSLRLVQGLANAGDVQLGSGTAQLSGAAIGNGGLILGRGRINNAVQNAGGRVQAQGGLLVLAGGVATAGGVLAVDSGATLRLTGPALDNQGRIELTGGTFDANGQAVTNSGTVSGAGVWRSGRVRQQGRIDIGSGLTEWQSGIDAQAGSRIVVSGLSRLVVQGSLDLLGGAELRVSEGSTATFFGDVALRNGALVTGSGQKFFEAGLSIGNSPATLQSEGDVSLGDGADYLAEIGAQAHDQLQVAGALHFGGQLRLVTLGGASFAAGQRFDLFDWGSASGQFARLDLSAAPLADGLSWDTSQLYVDGTLGVTAVPEPSAAMLLLSGLMAVSATAARRRPRPS